MRVSYAGPDAQVQEFLARTGNQIDVPDSVILQNRGGAYIEKQVREAIAKEQADAQQQAADSELLAARMDEQRQADAAAEAAAAESERIARDQERKAQLKEEFRGDIDRLASTNMQTAAALQGKVDLIDQTCRVWEERFEERFSEADQRLAQMNQLKSDLDQRQTRMEGAEGSNSLAIYQLTQQVTDLKAQNQELRGEIRRINLRLENSAS